MWGKPKACVKGMLTPGSFSFCLPEVERERGNFMISLHLKASHRYGWSQPIGTTQLPQFWWPSKSNSHVFLSLNFPNLLSPSLGRIHYALCDALSCSCVFRLKESVYFESTCVISIQAHDNVMNQVSLFLLYRSSYGDLRRLVVPLPLGLAPLLLTQNRKLGLLYSSSPSLSLLHERSVWNTL